MKATDPFVSIIVLNFDGKEWLKECLASLEKLHYPKDRYEVIMGDNGSTDGSGEYVAQNFSWVRIFRFRKNYGFCKANNLCARGAKGDYLVFLNNDTFVEKDWLRFLVEEARSGPNILSCASKMFFPQYKRGHLVQTAGGVIVPSGCGLYEGWMEEDSEAYNVPRDTGFGCAAGVLIERQFFLETGGFDEYYFYSGEEADLGFRVWAYGYKVRYVPTAVMYHFMGRTGFRGKGVTPTIEYLILRNSLYFILKNFEWVNVLKGILLYEARVVAKILYALAKGNFPILAAILKAHATLLKDRGKVLRVRREMQQKRRVTDKELRQKGVLISVPEFIRRNYRLVKNLKRYQTGDFYDTKDTVRVKVDEEGDWVFEKVQ
ncbi:MAG: hypothetical protein A3G87_00620 [Omnitrophica bacterium RIFCSPLOWO2_12_FULL_50_11]|nr:MAG: hypothetical protein A3G87_00620 [Omnitrophica bacterium RIFCSPLOWO2_12_FULL_50_11]